MGHARTGDVPNDQTAASGTASLAGHMRLLLQRVRHAQVDAEGQTIARIGTGLLVLVGFGAKDTPDLPRTPIWATMLGKIADLRVFPDEGGKMNRSLRDTGGEILLVSQFTLYADTRKGRRPGFSNACQPETAARLFDMLVHSMRTELADEALVQCGQFGADMEVTLTNWGPVTIMLDDTQFGGA